MVNASRVILKAPIWDGRKEPKIGIAEYRMMYEIIEVEITYTDRNNRRVFPNIYRINKYKALAYPLKMVKGTPLRIIPMKEFEEVAR